MIQPDKMELLSRRFDISDIEIIQGFHYIAIDSMINRFNEVFGLNWSQTIDKASIDFCDDYGTLDDGSTGLISKFWFANAKVSIEVGAPSTWVKRQGVGSAKAPFKMDPDMVIKTALANAFKKAANYFGVGQYLWKQSERDAITVLMEFESGNSTPALIVLKDQAMRKSGIDGKLTIKEIGEILEKDLTTNEGIKNALSELTPYSYYNGWELS